MDLGHETAETAGKVGSSANTGGVLTGASVAIVCWQHIAFSWNISLYFCSFNASRAFAAAAAEAGGAPLTGVGGLVAGAPCPAAAGVAAEQAANQAHNIHIKPVNNIVKSLPVGGIFLGAAAVLDLADTLLLLSTGLLNAIGTPGAT